MQAITEMRSTDGQQWMIIKKSDHHGTVAKTATHRDQLGTETLVPTQARSYIKNGQTVVFDGEDVPAEIISAVIAG